MNASHLIHLLWYAIIVIWLGAAFFSKRTIRRQSSGPRWLQAGVNGAGLAFLFSWHLRFGILGVRLVPASSIANAIGLGVAVGGCLLALYARFILGRNWSGDVTLKQDHALVLTGPYRWMRHPIYSGLLLLVLGTAIVFGIIASFVGLCLIFIGLWAKLRTEESFMLQQFGEQYRDYKQRVKALIPGVL